jgi:Glycosyltransferase family 87
VFKSDHRMSFPPKRTLPVLILLALGMAYYFFGLLLPQVRAGMRLQNRAGGYFCGNDLYPIWFTTGELLAHGTNPYTPNMEHRIETGLYARPLDRSKSIDAGVNFRGFSYPLYTDVLAIPLSLVSFRTVQISLIALFPILIILSVRWWAVGMGASFSRVELIGAALLTLFSVQVLEGLWALQPTILVGVILASAAAALRQSHLVTAGIAIALCSIKPQLIALVALWLLVWTCSDWIHRQRLVFALTLSGIVLLVLAEIWLPRWWMGWWHQLPNYRLYDSPALAELIFGKLIGHLLGLGIVALGAIAALRWRRSAADSAQFSLLIAFLLATSVVFISSSIAVYDQFLLLPAALQVWVNRQTILRNRIARFTTILLGGAFFWPWIAAPVVAIIHAIAPSLVSSRIVILPLITAGSFPLLLLAVMCILVLLSLRETKAERNPVLIPCQPRASEELA